MAVDFDVFFRENERRIHYQIHRLGIKGDWYADFYSEGIVALWEAHRKYDLSKNVELGTFVNYTIRYRLLDLFRKKLREQEKKEQLMEEKGRLLDDGNRHRGTGNPLVNMEGILLRDDSFWEDVRGRLTENQWKWVHYFIIAGMSVKEIMELEGVSADAVKGWGREARKKLRTEELRRRLVR